MSAVVSIVVARADNGVIGANGALPWRIPEDMKRFKALTFGKPVIMGRKTWDSLPRKPLPGRMNIVVTRDAAWKADGADIAHTLEDALRKGQQNRAVEIAVIGGVEIYRMALPHAGLVHLTEVHADATGDVTMPAFDRSHWTETAREDHTTADGLKYSYVTLVRK